jgi:hypothetical protein
MGSTGPCGGRQGRQLGAEPGADLVELGGPGPEGTVGRLDGHGDGDHLAPAGQQAELPDEVAPARVGPPAALEPCPAILPSPQRCDAITAAMSALTSASARPVAQARPRAKATWFVSDQEVWPYTLKAAGPGRTASG